jgi:outer membrane protein TolC
MRIKILMILPPLMLSILYGNSTSLKSIVDNAYISNNSLQSYEYKKQSKQQEINAQKKAYLPTVDIGASYQYNNPTSAVTAGRIQTVYGTASVDIFDWGRKSSLVNAKQYEYQASSLEKDAFAKNMTLDIVQSYFTAQKISANISSLKTKQKELSYQNRRMAAFVRAGLATNDDKDKLQASYDDNSYNISTAQMTLDEQYEHLKLISGLEFDTLSQSSIVNPTTVKPESYEKPKIIEAQQNVLKENIDALNATIMPQIKLQNTYTFSNFEDKPIGGFDGMFQTNKNTLMLTATMRVYDGGVASRQEEAIKLQGLALNEDMLRSQKEQVSLYRVAKEKLSALRSKIKSANSAAQASSSTYVSIKEKFGAGLVDNVSYLDALNSNAMAQFRVKEAQYDYEIAKSSFYYFAGKNPREYIK